MRYAVVVEKGENNYSAYVPDLPGCVAAAETQEELLELIQEAIDLHLQSMREGEEDALSTPSTEESVE